MDKLSYALGIGIGSQLAGMGAKELNIDDFAQAIKDVISGAGLKVDNAEAQTLVQNFFQEQEAKQQAAKPLRLVKQQRLPVKRSLQRMQRRMESLHFHLVCSIRC